jgi:hypothetical protein
VSRRALDLLLFATLVVITWDKIRWETNVVDLTLSNLLATAYILVAVGIRIADRDARMPPAAITLAGFMLAFAAIYLCGYFNLTDAAALNLWLKGITVWAVHFAFLVLAVAQVVRGGAPLLLRAWKWFVLGIAVNAAYGVVQLVAQALAGVNLDEVVVGRITSGRGGIGGINVFGSVGDASIYRINALTGDPNHLGVILCVPLLTLLALLLRAPRARPRIAALLVFFFAVQVLTLSRSAAVGDVAGLLVLSPYLARHAPPLRWMVGTVAGLAGAFLALYTLSDYVRRVVEVRLQTSGGGSQVHLYFYELAPRALDPNPLLGMGFNTFAVFYEFVTGRPDFGPHSIWIAVLVETGAIGFALYVAYVAYLVAAAARGRDADDRDVARLAAGLVAAIVATAVANLFYLTMQFDYFFAVALIAVACAALAPARARGRAPAAVAQAAGD